MIEQVEPEDAGRYRCRVANVAGMLYHDVNLIVRSGCGICAINHCLVGMAHHVEWIYCTNYLVGVARAVK